MIVQTNVKAGGRSAQHNEKLARETGKLRLRKETVRELKGFTVKTGVKAGGVSWGGSNANGCENHNEKMICNLARQ